MWTPPGNLRGFFMKLTTLKKRADFLRAQRGRKAVRATLLIQLWDRDDGEPVRFGFTASKKVGNAVKRARAKRRLRAAAATLDHPALTGHDVVLVARKETPEAEFSLILKDVSAAIQKVMK